MRVRALSADAPTSWLTLAVMLVGRPHRRSRAVVEGGGGKINQTRFLMNLRSRCRLQKARGRPRLKRCARRSLRSAKSVLSPGGQSATAQSRPHTGCRGQSSWLKPTTRGGSNQHPALLVKTGRPWRDTVPLTHLAREGRMAVTIGRRELLAALSGAAAAWPLAVSARGSRRSANGRGRSARA